MAKTFQSEKKQQKKQTTTTTTKKKKRKNTQKTHLIKRSQQKKNNPKTKQKTKQTKVLQYGQNVVVCFIQPFFKGARCSSMVSAFGYGAMGRRIDPSWVAISRSSHCSKTGVTKTVVCDTLYVGRCI